MTVTAVTAPVIVQGHLPGTLYVCSYAATVVDSSNKSLGLGTPDTMNTLPAP